jgi:putative membrane protein
MMWIDHDVSGWGYAWMGIGMVAFWGLVIAGIVVLVRYLARSEQPRGGPPAHRPPSPEQVLAERFARGEIDEEEYRRRLETLRSAGSTPSRT